MHNAPRYPRVVEVVVYQHGKSGPDSGTMLPWSGVNKSPSGAKKSGLRIYPAFPANCARISQCGERNYKPVRPPVSAEIDCNINNLRQGSDTMPRTIMIHQQER